MTRIREVFHEAVVDPEKSKAFHEYISEYTSSEPVIMAYQAVSEALLAQTIWNPLAKYAHVKRFQEQMAVVMAMDNENLEIRFLRFAVEYYLPRFLMMSDHLEKDRDFLIENLSSLGNLEVDHGFARYILYFLNETGMVDNDQLIEIRASFTPGLLRSGK